jgi:hypothetical protein
MPTLKRSQVLTLKEAKSFLELDGGKVRSLIQAAELWASEPPPDAVSSTPPTPQGDAFTWNDDEYGFV